MTGRCVVKAPPRAPAQRRYNEFCPLCIVCNSDAAARSEIWASWSPKAGGWRPVAVILARFGYHTINGKTINAHFRSHGVNQPPAPRVTRRAAACALVDAQPSLTKDLIDLVWRAKLLTTAQVATLAFPAQPLAVGMEMARMELSEMSRLHWLHRYTPHPRLLRPDGEPEGSVWYLGRHAVPWLERHFDTAIPRHHTVSDASEVPLTPMRHDVGANRVAIEMIVAGRDRGVFFPVGERTARVALRPANWWGSKHLAMAYYDRHRREMRSMVPDGFIAPSVVVPPSETRRGTEALMPLFLEYDRGSREAFDVIDQIIGYHWMSASGSARSRFPDLAVPGYSVPMLMVFTKKRRAKYIADRVHALATERGATNLAPLMIVHEDDTPVMWSEAVVRNVSSPDCEPRPLGPLMLALSAPLIDYSPLHTASRLRIDRSAARPLAQSSGATPAAWMRSRAGE